MDNIVYYQLTLHRSNDSGARRPTLTVVNYGSSCKWIERQLGIAVLLLLGLK